MGWTNVKIGTEGTGALMVQTIFHHYGDTPRKEPHVTVHYGSTNFPTFSSRRDGRQNKQSDSLSELVTMCAILITSVPLARAVVYRVVFQS